MTPPTIRNPTRAAARAHTMAELDDVITGCGACPRLVRWRREVAANPKAAWADTPYWGRPVPGFGDPSARMWVVGLAPAAHGANRTGRMFTGDRSGDWLFRSLHAVGVANQPTSATANDGLVLRGVRVTSAVHCAPPDNRPTTDERDCCGAWLRREHELLADVAVVVALGHFAHGVVCSLLDIRPRPRFGHGVETTAPGGTVVVGSYHPSQQNTFTGRLTEPMLTGVLQRAAALAGLVG